MMEGNFEQLALLVGENICEECGSPYPNHYLDCSRFHEKIEEEKLPEVEIVAKEEKKVEQKKIPISQEMKSMIKSIKFQIDKIISGYETDKLEKLDFLKKEKLIGDIFNIIDKEIKGCRNCDWNEMVSVLMDYSGELIGLANEAYVAAIKRKFPLVGN